MFLYAKFEPFAFSRILASHANWVFEIGLSTVCAKISVAFIALFYWIWTITDAVLKVFGLSWIRFETSIFCLHFNSNIIAFLPLTLNTLIVWLFPAAQNIPAIRGLRSHSNRLIFKFNYYKLTKIQREDEIQLRKNFFNKSSSVFTQLQFSIGINRFIHV